jgi:hypothetical protein
MRKEVTMPRTKHALSKVARLGTRYSAAAAAVTLIAGLAAIPAAARPDPGRTVMEQSTDSVSDQSEFARFSCTPVDTAVYDPMQDYVETLIWWHYHPDWRVG